MKDIFGKIKLTFGITFGIVLFVILSPILLILFPFLSINNRKSEREYQDFIDSNEGKKFFCYTSRRNSRNFIQNFIIPKLDDDINLIFLNGKNPTSDLPQRFISRMLYRIDNIGFPNVMKIVNGSVIDISLKKDFYNNLKDNKEESEFIDLIKLSFEILDEK